MTPAGRWGRFRAAVTRTVVASLHAAVAVWKALAALGFVLLLVWVAVVGGRRLTEPLRPAKPTPEVRDARILSQTERFVSIVSPRLQYSKIRKSVMRIGSERPAAAVTLSLGSARAVGSEPFKIYEYTIKDSSLFERLPRQTCETLSGALAEQGRLEKALREIEGTLSVTPAGVGVDIPLPVDAFVELLGVLRLLLHMDDTRADVLVRGYADGELGPWFRPLLTDYDGRYVRNFQEFEYLPCAEANINCSVFSDASQLFQLDAATGEPADHLLNRNELGTQYRNKALPFLRSRFIAFDILERGFKDHPCPVPTTVRILEGDVDEDIDAALRKAEVHVLLYRDSAVDPFDDPGTGCSTFPYRGGNVMVVLAALTAAVVRRRFGVRPAPRRVI